LLTNSGSMTAARDGGGRCRIANPKTSEYRNKTH
jgi:hypothetical protein